MAINRNQLIEQLLDDVRATVRRISIAARSDADKAAIPRSQAYVMHLVCEHPGMSVKEVARAMDISASAATQLVEILVSDGDLERQPSQQDRRVVTLAISRQGKERYQKFKAFQLARIHPLMESLTDEELTEFGRIHRKLLDAVHSDPGFKTFEPITPSKKASKW